ncbi:serine/threonine kinase [Pectobacterium phage PcCB251]|uniref:Serine/threonine kinase n=1 Tax=Pectobacterium phage PcCB251 TaxID=2798045 RepID=A0AAE7P2L5_9CAUD|nr:serine/threonine kinase [Pectobacterium phage PcCB251]
MNTFGSRIHTALDVIKNLPIDALDERQPRLVSLMADLVNHETSDGDYTDHHSGCESQDYWNTLMIYTRDVGFEFLGAGHFSAAFKHDLLPGKVIKVGFKKEDSGAAYAAWCRMNQGRAGVPTIHAIARHAGCYTVVLDELREFDYDESTMLNAYYALASSMLYGCQDTDTWDDFSMDLKQTMWDIRAFFNDIASFDLHRGNVMVNNKGELVITDPVSWTNGDKVSRDKFQIDADELIAEIEAAAQEEAIERCRNRKAKCNPNGTFWINRKAEMKRRKHNRKVCERNAKQNKAFPAQCRIEHKQELREARRARIWLGQHNWHNMWLNNHNEDVIRIDKENALKWQVAGHMAIIKGRSLPIDKLLDAQLMG